jgi:hypothetical protein
MKARRYVQIGVLLAVLLVFEQSGIAALWEDPNAMDDWSGWVKFPALALESGGALSGQIDYAVYEPGKYDGSIDLYVYAYQVFNDSTVAINYFSVGLSTDVQVSDAWCDPAMSWAKSGGSIPGMSLPLSENVLYVFQAGNIKAGKWSATLLFTSDYSPEMGIGVVPGGVAGSVNVEVPSPSPVPEPATLALISGGAFLALRRKRKDRRPGEKQGKQTVLIHKRTMAKIEVSDEENR